MVAVGRRARRGFRGAREKVRITRNHLRCNVVNPPRPHPETASESEGPVHFSFFRSPSFPAPPAEPPLAVAAPTIPSAAFTAPIAMKICAA